MKIDLARMIGAEARAETALAEAKASARTVVLAALAARTEALAGNAPLTEWLGWAAKEAEARALLDHGAEAPCIAVEAAVTGESQEALARRILARAAATRHGLAVLTGFRRKAEAMLETADSLEAVAALCPALVAEAEALAR